MSCTSTLYHSFLLLPFTFNDEMYEQPSFICYFSLKVASAGYGLDLITAIDILKAIRSANGFVVTIIMKPFSFEGQRRQDEVTLGSIVFHDWPF